ncbi:MAG: hypothetical protein HY075_03245 [Deltaproteobacteria bacterium]|nr:hypothetical protein [Deltaproteobacteria bacterium]
MSRTFLAFIAAGILLSGLIARSDDFSPGKFGADAIFVHPIGGPGDQDTIRAALSVSAVTIDTTFSKMEAGIFEATGATNIASGVVSLPKFKVTALRAAFHQVTADFASFYRNADQGVDYGGDIISVRVPIRITEGGAIIIQPGLEMGVRHYVAPVDQTSFHATAVVEARAATDLVENWLSTGIMAKVKYDLDTNMKMSGFSETATAYLSLVLDRDHQMYARIYAGVDHQQSRSELGLPTVDAFGGVGIYGNFGK